MQLLNYGDVGASTVLIQPVDDHDLVEMDAEIFGSGAAEMLQFILEQCQDRRKTYYLGGYSLAGLFSLWAAWQVHRLDGCKTSALFLKVK